MTQASIDNVRLMTIKGKRYAVVPVDRWHALCHAALPPLPEPDAEGFRPAVVSARAIMARTLIQQRTTAGLTQKELARLAGVRVETVSRLESGKHRPQRETVLRLEAALNRAQRKTRRRPRAA